MATPFRGDSGSGPKVYPAAEAVPGSLAHRAVRQAEKEGNSFVLGSSRSSPVGIAWRPKRTAQISERGVRRARRHLMCEREPGSRAEDGHHAQGAFDLPEPTDRIVGRFPRPDLDPDVRLPSARRPRADLRVNRRRTNERALSRGRPGAPRCASSSSRRKRIAERRARSVARVRPARSSLSLDERRR
jgi:hypothetical protein